jgi:hypothetical protein
MPLVGLLLGADARHRPSAGCYRARVRGPVAGALVMFVPIRNLSRRREPP